MENDKRPYCPFQSGFTHNSRPARAFSLGFQHFGICAECLRMALDGCFAWRWRPPHKDEKCLRCNSPASELFEAAPGEASLGICLHCLKAGRAFLDAPEENEGLFAHQTNTAEK